MYIFRLQCCFVIRRINGVPTFDIECFHCISDKLCPVGCGRNHKDGILVTRVTEIIRLRLVKFRERQNSIWILHVAEAVEGVAQIGGDEQRPADSENRQFIRPLVHDVGAGIFVE